jgi:hypothetical protein
VRCGDLDDEIDSMTVGLTRHELEQLLDAAEAGGPRSRRADHAAGEDGGDGTDVSKRGSDALYV